MILSNTYSLDIQEFDNENKFNFKSIREVLDYLSEISEMVEFENAFNSSYNSVTGDNYVNDSVLYTEFKENTRIRKR